MHVGLVTRSEMDYALDLANELYGAGMSVTLYLSYDHVVKMLDEAERPIESIYELGLLPAACKVRLLKLPRMRDPRSFNLFLELKHTIYKDGVEMVNVLLNPGEAWLALLTCLINDMSVATTLIVPVANVGERLPGFIVWAVNKLAVFGSDLVIVNGAKQVQLVQEMYRIPSDRVIHVPLSLNMTSVRFLTNDVQEEPGTILFFGRSDPHKGLEYLVKAQPIISHHLPYARILISAHGKELSRYRAMIKDHSKFEIIDGFVSGDSMATTFQRTSMVVLPYLSASTSGVLMMAYCHSKPVVATNVGCLPEYIEDGITGLLVPPGDVEQLAKAIIHILSDNGLRYSMVSNIKSWVKKYQRDIVSYTLEAYEKALEYHRRS